MPKPTIDVERLAVFLNKNNIQCFSRDAAIQTLKNIEEIESAIKQETDIEFRLQIRDYVDLYKKVLGINLAQGAIAARVPKGKSNIVSITGDKLDLPDGK